MRLPSISVTPVRWALWVVFIQGIALVLAVPASAQITTNTALPVAKGVGIFRIQAKVLRSSGDESAMNRKLTVLLFPAVLVYGVTPKLAAFGMLPILDRQLEISDPAGRIERRVSGLADARAFLRYTIYQKDDHGATFRIAPFAGAKVPTGSTDASDDMGALPRSLQLGSGSWDPFIGAVLTRQTFSWQIDASLSYQFNSTADRFRFGDEARLDVASKVRLLPRLLGEGLPNFLYANLESNLVWHGRNKINGIDDIDSGGTIWYLDPGLQFITRRVVIETAIQLPILQDLNGTALENDFIFILSARLAF
ncbi:MAG: transporter [Bacteroidetes bacterium]|nr:transporter [Bacteroidota bacterium]